MNVHQRIQTSIDLAVLNQLIEHLQGIATEARERNHRGVLVRMEQAGIESLAARMAEVKQLIENLRVEQAMGRLAP